MVALLAAPSAFAQSDDDFLVPLTPQKSSPSKSKTAKKGKATKTPSKKTAKKKTPPKPKKPKKGFAKKGKKGKKGAPKEELAAQPVDPVDLVPLVPQGKTELLVKLGGGLKGGRLYVDNKEVGVFPVSALEIAPGEHTLTVRRPGYAEYSQRITAEAGRLTEVEASLDAVAAVVAVTADVPGASVLIDGEPAGKAPLYGVALKPGSHEIEARREGFVSETKRIAVRAGRDYTVDFLLRPSGDAPRVGRDAVASGPTLTPRESQPTEVAARALDPDAQPTDEVEGGGKPLYKRWYFWAGVGAVTAAAVVGTVALTQPAAPVPLSPDQVCGGTCDAVINAPGIVRF
jgi:hypothetical protein